MSIQSFEELLLAVKKLPTKRLAVAVAQDREVLRAVDTAYRKGIAEATLVGNENEILHIAETECLDLSPFKIINKRLTEALKKRIGFLAPIHVYPGEIEMEALALSTLAVLEKKSIAKEYTGEPVFTGFEAWKEARAKGG